MFLRRSIASLARAYKIHVYDFFFMSVHLGVCPPPPHTKKLATLRLPAFAHQKSGQMKMADSVPPPPPPLATRNRRHCMLLVLFLNYGTVVEVRIHVKIRSITLFGCKAEKKKIECIH